MIKHVVIFKLTPSYTPEEKQRSVMKLKEIFGPVGNKLDYAIEYRTGINILDDDHAGDFIIDSTFTSPEDLQRYQTSDLHQEAVAQAAMIRKAKVVVDYII
jgi:hypothetical protein